MESAGYVVQRGSVCHARQQGDVVGREADVSWVAIIVRLVGSITMSRGVAGRWGFAWVLCHARPLRM